MADYTLSVDVEAVDKASSVFDTISGNVKSFESQVSETQKSVSSSLTDIGDSMKSVGNSMSSVGSTLTSSVTQPIIALGTTAVTTAKDFDAGMSKVQAISGATATEMEELSTEAQRMASQTIFSLSDTADAYQYMGMAGWKSGEMVTGLSAIMYLAGATGEDLASTSDIVTDALTAFGLTANDATHFTDVLSQTATNANTDVSMMGESFKYCAPVAGALGFEVEDVAEAIGLMANSGIKGSSAGTALRSTFVALSHDVDLSGEAFGDVTIATQNADGSMRDLNDILDDCRVYFDQMTESERASAAQSLVGKNAMSGFLALMNSGADDIDKLRTAIENCDGSTEAMYNTMNDNLEGQMQELNSALDVLAYQFGTLIVPYVTQFVGVLQDVVAWFSSLDDGTKNFIITAAMLVAALGPILLIGGKLITGLGTIVSTVGKVGSLIGSVGSAASAAAAPVASAGTAVGTLSSNALGFVALGAGILLVAAGMWVLAEAAIAISDAGAPAAIAMGAMVAVIAALAVGAAALGPALTAGAVGLVAFGAAVALIGTGVLAASAGIALLATQLPTISEYGASAAVAIAELGAALLVYAGGAATAGAASLVLGSGLLVAGGGAVTAAAGGAALTVAIVALSGAVAIAAASITALGGALNLCASPLKTMGANATSSATGTVKLTTALAALLIPAGSSAGILVAACAALLAFDAEMAVGAVAVAAMDVALVAMLESMSGIASAASSASTSMSEVQASLDIVKAGLDGLGDLFKSAINTIVSTFSNNTGSAQSAAQAFASAITNGTKSGLQPITTNTNQTLSQLLQMLTTNKTKALVIETAGFTAMNANATTAYSKLKSNTTTVLNTLTKQFQTTLNQISQMFANCKLQFKQSIALPHFSMSGTFDAKTKQVPTVNVSWYKSAYDQAMMFSTPTIYGASGFGDGNGTEIVVGDEHLIELMQDAFKDINGGGTTVIPVYIGQERIDEIVVNANNRNNYRSGGR